MTTTTTCPNPSSSSSSRSKSPVWFPMRRQVVAALVAHILVPHLGDLAWFEDLKMNRPDCSHPVDKQLIIFILILFFSPSPQARSRVYLWALRRLRFVPHYFQVRVSSCTFQHFIFDVSAPRMINQWHSILTTYSHTQTDNALQQLAGIVSIGARCTWRKTVQIIISFPNCTSSINIMKRTSCPNLK